MLQCYLTSKLKSPKKYMNLYKKDLGSQKTTCRLLGISWFLWLVVVVVAIDLTLVVVVQVHTQVGREVQEDGCRWGVLPEDPCITLCWVWWTVEEGVIRVGGQVAPLTVGWRMNDGVDLMQVAVWGWGIARAKLHHRGSCLTWEGGLWWNFGAGAWRTRFSSWFWIVLAAQAECSFSGPPYSWLCPFFHQLWVVGSCCHIWIWGWVSWVLVAQSQGRHGLGGLLGW